MAIQNCTSNKVVLAQGTWLLQIEVKKFYTSPSGVEWNELESRLGSTSRGWTELEKKEMEANISAEFYQVTELNELEAVRKELLLMCPTSMSLGSLNINFLGSGSGSGYDYAEERYYLKAQERRFSSSCHSGNYLPSVNKTFALQDVASDRSGCPSFHLENYRQLEHRELVELQNEDERISKIKEALSSGDEVLFKKFTMRSGIVCRKFFSKINGKVLLTVYVPSCIVRDVLLHTHLEGLHPSGRQTYRSFSESLYRPHTAILDRPLSSAATKEV